jgi:hypothetical protein
MVVVFNATFNNISAITLSTLVFFNMVSVLKLPRINYSCELESRLWRGVLDITLCDKNLSVSCDRAVVFPGTPVSSINKIDRHDIAEILLKVALNTINQTYI